MDICEDGRHPNRCRDANGSETGRDVVLRAASDHAVTRDPRALHRLTAMEKTCQVSPYFDRVQTDIQPYMRRILAAWMFEVCKLVKRSQIEIKYTRLDDFKGTTDG